MHIETTPALDAERYILMFCSELVAHLRETDLLDHLKTINRTATLAVILELFRHQVADHCLQSQFLLAKLNHIRASLYTAPLVRFLGICHYGAEISETESSETITEILRDNEALPSVMLKS